jgi:hypothetical protein
MLPPGGDTNSGRTALRVFLVVVLGAVIVGGVALTLRMTGGSNEATGGDDVACGNEEERAFSEGDLDAAAEHVWSELGWSAPDGPDHPGQFIRVTTLPMEQYVGVEVSPAIPPELREELDAAIAELRPCIVRITEADEPFPPGYD